MYHQKMAVAIKTKGRVLRENKDQVILPFGSEYSVVIKNLHTRRSIVNVYIDGSNITPGGLLIDAGREVDLQRSLANGSLTEGNALKFIERTGAVEQHRGIKLEDGIVRIEFEFEREQPQWYSSNANSIWNINDNVPYYGVTCNNTYQGPLRGRGTSSIASASLNNIQISSQTTSYNDAGITVAGSKSDQKFQTVTGVYGDGTKHNIVLKLLGETPDNKPVIKEVTVKSKPKCTTCGRQNKHTAKFCTECGASLEIFA